MSKQGVRHTSVSPKPATASRQLAENARDTNDVLVRKVSGYYAEVPRYAAVGATSTRIRLAQRGDIRPRAVILVHACATDNPGGDLGAVGRLNFYHDTTGIGVYEPSGLTANVKYDLTFLVLE